jgi:hypothetical protein
MHRTVAIRAYRIAGAMAILVAIGYQVSMGLGWRHWSVTDYFSYFTILSNLLAASVFLYGAVHAGGPRSATAELLRGAAVVYMLTTGIVYAILLSGEKATTPWVNTIVHQVMPLVVAFDWVFDPPQLRLATRRALVWLAFPLAYVTYTLIRGPLAHWYPYFFLDPDRSGGYPGVIAGCIAIGVGIIGLILLVTWAANRRGAAALSGNG